MIAPIAIAAVALYGWFRYDKAKKAKELSGLLAAPPAATTHPAFAPSPTLFKSISSAVQQQKPTGGTGATLTGSLGKIFGVVAKTGPVGDPNAIPSGRIASSAYGATGPGAPPPAPSGGISTSAEVKFKL